MKTRHRKLHAFTWFALAPALLLLIWLSSMNGESTQPVNQELTPELIGSNAPKGAIP